MSYYAALHCLLCLGFLGTVPLMGANAAASLGSTCHADLAATPMPNAGDSSQPLLEKDLPQLAQLPKPQDLESLAKPCHDLALFSALPGLSETRVEEDGAMAPGDIHSPSSWEQNQLSQQTAHEDDRLTPAERSEVFYSGGLSTAGRRDLGPAADWGHLCAQPVGICRGYGRPQHR